LLNVCYREITILDVIVVYTPTLDDHGFWEIILVSQDAKTLVKVCWTVRAQVRAQLTADSCAGRNHKCASRTQCVWGNCNKSRLPAPNWQNDADLSVRICKREVIPYRNPSLALRDS
jgi:hypothetical protein